MYYACIDNSLDGRCNRALAKRNEPTHYRYHYGAAAAGRRETEREREKGRELCFVRRSLSPPLFVSCLIFMACCARDVKPQNSRHTETKWVHTQLDCGNTPRFPWIGICPTRRLQDGGTRLDWVESDGFFFFAGRQDLIRYRLFIFLYCWAPYNSVPECFFFFWHGQRSRNKDRTNDKQRFL